MKRYLLPLTILLMTAICLSGCTVNVGGPAPTPAPSTVQPLPQTITAEPTTAAVPTTVFTATTPGTTAPTEKEVLHEKGILTTKTYVTYDF